jgi:hypothetical protein
VFEDHEVTVSREAPRPGSLFHVMVLPPVVALRPEDLGAARADASGPCEDPQCRTRDLFVHWHALDVEADVGVLEVISNPEI